MSTPAETPVAVAAPATVEAPATVAAIEETPILGKPIEDTPAAAEAAPDAEAAHIEAPVAEAAAPVEVRIVRSLRPLFGGRTPLAVPRPPRLPSRSGHLYID